MYLRFLHKVSRYAVVSVNKDSHLSRYVNGILSLFEITCICQFQEDIIRCKVYMFFDWSYLMFVCSYFVINCLYFV